MSNVSYPILILVAAIGGGGTLAWFHEEAPPPASAPSAAKPAEELPDMASDVSGQELPPNHPAIGAGGAMSAGAMHNGAMHGGAATLPPAEDERASISWKVPAGWQTLENPTSIRLATYATAGADVSVSRAGGGTDANIERWVRQFDDAGQEKRSVKTVRGLKVVVVEVSGTYLGSGMALPAAGADEHANDKKSWALLGAVVETPGSSYFFKMTGPAASVKSAHKSFDALLDSVTPTAE
ncbi:MAG: hypothetical protein JWM74_4610 [Myxococcaceae bacterium]|nr:hypothetical protein [Myxococcaceae bacterium]